MICQNCGTENITSAHYCKSCGSKFTDEERQEAYDKTIYGKLDMLGEAKSIVTLGKITGNTVVRIIVLAAILLYGLFLVYQNGSRFAIRQSDAYDVAYNSELDEYYIGTDSDSFTLLLYLPRSTKTIGVTRFDAQNRGVGAAYYEPDDDIILTKEDGFYYHIAADYGGKTERITVYIVPKDSF